MRKTRTREHIIEDLGFNHVERQVLKAGYVVQRSLIDYGLDGENIPINHIFTPDAMLNLRKKLNQ